MTPLSTLELRSPYSLKLLKLGIRKEASKEPGVLFAYIFHSMTWQLWNRVSSYSAKWTDSFPCGAASHMLVTVSQVACAFRTCIDVPRAVLAGQWHPAVVLSSALHLYLGCNHSAEIRMRALYNSLGPLCSTSECNAGHALRWSESGSWNLGFSWLCHLLPVAKEKGVTNAGEMFRDVCGFIRLLIWTVCFPIACFLKFTSYLFLFFLAIPR